MVFHCFSLIFMAFLDFRCHGQGKWKKNDKHMKKNDKQMIKTWKFPRVFEDFLVRSENLQLWVQIFTFFSFATSFFFHFPLFLMVFHCFSWLSWISGATGKENEKKNIKTWKKHDKKMIKNENFLVFEDFLVRSENLQLWVQIFIFFSFATSFFFIFLCFWWFSIVFHCFSWLSWISGATGKENEKKNDKKMKKTW